MLQKLIRSKADFTLNTSIEMYMLSIDEVRWVKFKNEEQAQSLFKLGQIEGVPETTPLRKAIPILYPTPTSARCTVPVFESKLVHAIPGVPMESGVDELLKKMREKVCR